MCRSLPGRWPVPLLLLLLTGCAASTLQLQHEPPPYLSDLRAEYFSANPDTPFREDVNRSAVVTGMDIYDVLASWGRPARRVRAGAQEEWTYYEIDASGDALEFNLAFRSGKLDGWDTRLHKNTGLAYRSNQVDPVLISEPPAGKKVPTN